MLFKNPLLVVLSSLFVYITAHSQYTYVPDDNFEQFLIDSGYDNGPLDDYVLTSNIDHIPNLSISGNADYIWQIKSIQGIEDFTSLRTLTIDLNEVTEIDLSSNINLEELDIINDALLENLNISNNINLVALRCINAGIATLDLSNNTKLTNLVIGTTGLLDIDLSNNTNLQVVEITFGAIETINIKNGNNTNITYFNAEGNFNLACVQVDDVNYSITNWTNIDENSVYKSTCGNTQQLTYVPDDNFEQELINLGYDSGSLDDYVLTSNINTITTLNLNNLNISDLTGIQDFIALENLQFSGNQVSTVNLTTLTNLQTLNCVNNNISELDVTNNNQLINLFSGDNPINQLNVTNNPLLEQLEINNANLSVINLSNNQLINWLSISNNNLTSISLNNNLELTYFYCSNNNLSGTIDLSVNSKLFEFSCSNNPLNEIVLPANNILDGLHVNSTLITELDLRNQANLITHPASFLEIQNNPNLICVFVDDVDRYNDDIWSSITKDAQSNFVANEAECRALTCNINATQLNDVTACDFYVLQNLTSGNYYTQSGGNGNLLNAGDTISNSQVIYIYEQDPSDTSCFDESSFQITINTTPNVDTYDNVSSCNSFILPNTTNGNYYTSSGGNGNLLNAGDTILSTQTIYIYNTNGNCYNESSFEVTINEIPQVTTLSDVEASNSYQLPNITDGNYYTLSGGNGNLLNAGDLITESQLIFIYNENSSGCYNESNFTVTITNIDVKIPHFFTPNQDGINDFWIIESTKNIKEINIYNRFGTLIASPNIDSGWDGISNGRKMPSNTYWYKIIFDDNTSKMGSFSLLRK
jgi:gliding motility-associated-like protein